MLRTILAAIIMAFPYNLYAQDLAPAMCPLMSTNLVKLVANYVKGKGNCEASCKGCGCKGGPGYRKDGRCVAWADVERKCGKAPHAGCVKECRRVVPACLDRALGIAWLIKFAAENGEKVELQPPDPVVEPQQ